MNKNDAKLRIKLRKLCDKAGSQKRWATANKFAESYVSEVLSGRRDFSKAMKAAIGYEELEYIVDEFLTVTGDE